MKKIAAIVSYKYLPPESGGQKYISNFLKHLATCVNLTVIGTNNNETSGVQKYAFKKWLLKNPFSYIDIKGLFRMYNYIKENKISTVIIEHPYIGWMGILLKKILGVKIIIQTHNVEYLRFKTLHKWWWPILKTYEKWVLKKADVILCISDEDKTLMKGKLGISNSKCFIVPFGINQHNRPNDKKQNKDLICKIHGLDSSKTLLLFNGLLDYKPNTEAVEFIIENIIPNLKETNFEFNLMIAGKNLPPILANKLTAFDNITYTGFVEDIDKYIKAADIFLNPVISGGGVKTKLIEALGMNCTCISTASGAVGLDKNVCGNKLIITEDHDWEIFSKEIILASKKNEDISESFYSKYNWTEIIKSSQYFL